MDAYYSFNPEGYVNKISKRASKLEKQDIIDELIDGEVKLLIDVSNDPSFIKKIFGEELFENWKINKTKALRKKEKKSAGAVKGWRTRRKSNDSI